MRDYLGELEHVVLLAVLRLGSDSYGVTIREEIYGCTGRSISPGTIYPTLDRLERKGLVESVFGPPVAERGGRSRRVYGITPRGLAALRASEQALGALRSGFEDVLVEPDTT